MGRLAAIAFAVGLAGCPEYEVTVETVVAPDGKVQRALSFEGGPDESLREEFEKPAGHAESEGRLVASLAPGSHPSGIRRRQKEFHPEPVEGEFGVEVEDLVIGKLYRYREIVATGADGDRFRKDVPRWLDFCLDAALRELRTRWPDLGWDACEKEARAVLLPKLDRAVAVVHARWAALAPGDEDAVRLWEETFRAEMARLGAETPEDRDVDSTLEAYTEGPLVDAFLLPLGDLDAGLGQEIRTFIREGDWDGIARATYEGGEEQLEKDFGRFLIAGIGIYSVSIFTNHDLRFSVRLPGRVLRANGELGATPEIRWSLRNENLVATSPVLHAVSFAPAEGVRDGAWRVEALEELGKAIATLDEAQRAKLRALGLRVLEETPPELSGVAGAMREALE